MLRWLSLRMLPQKGQGLHTRPLPLPRQASSHRLFRRGSLLAELDRVPDADKMETTVSNASTATSGGVSSSSLVQSENYFAPSPFAKNLEAVAMSVDSSFDMHSSVSRKPRNTHREGTLFSSLDTLKAQQTALREMFADAKSRSIRMQKDKKWLREEQRAFELSHGHFPTKKEVSPFVDIELTPVAALKLTKHLSPKSSAHDVVMHSIRLQQSVTRNKLVQSGEKTLFRCLRCFHVYSARPRTLFGEEVGHSWMQYEAERRKVSTAQEIARCPKLRKSKYSIGRQRDALAEDPRSCPLCGSPKAQWFMEYVHQSTHK